MSSSREALRRAALRGTTLITLTVLGAAIAAGAAAQGPARSAAAEARPEPAAPTTFAGIGRPATAKEVAAWDIDVRPDFRGLPKGAGSVARGQDVWEGKCASCHGVFGEANEVFSPLIGGTTPDDVRTGRVARLLDPAYPQRTTLMKVSTLSTLWDYINRAMPWNAPKSLPVDDVYAVTAYILNMGGIVPDDYTLSDRNIAETQARLPNRNGVTTEHAMWPGAGPRQPDVRPAACMTNCAPEPKLASFLPEHARNAHGNLAQQQRLVGAQVGADTSRPAGSAPSAPAADAHAGHGAAPAPVTAAAAAASVDGKALAAKAQCLVCHGVDNKVVGPGFKEVGRKYAQRGDGVDYLAAKIRSGGSGVWGPIPMPAQPAVSEADARTLAQWVMGVAGSR